jgi:hypothetical protein
MKKASTKTILKCFDRPGRNERQRKGMRKNQDQLHFSSRSLPPGGDTCQYLTVKMVANTEGVSAYRQDMGTKMGPDREN